MADQNARRAFAASRLRPTTLAEVRQGEETTERTERERIQALRTQPGRAATQELSVLYRRRRAEGRGVI